MNIILLEEFSSIGAGGSRIMKKCILVFLLLALSMTTGCSSREMELGADDNGRAVELAMGQVLTVTLESNPTTGYRWEITELDEQVLASMGEAEYQPGSNLVGASGMEILRFKAVNEGHTSLDLAYRRPWEQDVEPLELFSLQVVVR